MIIVIINAIKALVAKIVEFFKSKEQEVINSVDAKVIELKADAEKLAKEIKGKV